MIKTKSNDNLLIVSSSPHIRTSVETKHIMRDVLIALTPISIASVVLFGVRSLWLLLVCVAASVLTELIYQKLLGKKITVYDGSAAVTGMLVGLNLPVTVPFWIAGIGCVFAILVVKQLFGGLGKNFANPAIVGRIVLLLSFPTQLNHFVPSRFELVPDGLSYATPFHLNPEWYPHLKPPTYLDMFLGKHGGSIGETCILALLIGFIYLVVRRVITVTAPISFVGTVFVVSFLMGKDPVFEMLAGGLVLAAIFMATDYVTTPTTEWGKLIFGVGAGLLTVFIRTYSDFPEGVSFAILLMNIVTPYIEKATRLRALGEVKQREKV